MNAVPHDGEILKLTDVIRQTSFEIQSTFAAGLRKRFMRTRWRIDFERREFGQSSNNAFGYLTRTAHCLAYSGQTS
jgi:hypothetical protein